MTKPRAGGGVIIIIPLLERPEAAMAPSGAAAERQRRGHLLEERSGRYCFSETCGRPRPHEWEGPASTAQREGRAVEDSEGFPKNNTSRKR